MVDVGTSDDQYTFYDHDVCSDNENSSAHPETGKIAHDSICCSIYHGVPANSALCLGGSIGAEHLSAGTTLYPRLNKKTLVNENLC